MGQPRWGLAGAEEANYVSNEPMIQSPALQITGRTASVPHAFEAQVDRTPTAIALESAERRLTYAEVDRLANQVARRLQSARGGARGRDGRRRERRVPGSHRSMMREPDVAGLAALRELVDEVLDGDAAGVDEPAVAAAAR